MNKKPVHLNWASLKVLFEGEYRRQCPFCKEGVLPMQRSSDTYELLDWDRCTGCGQVVIYDDIEHVRNTSP